MLYQLLMMPTRGNKLWMSGLKLVALTLKQVPYRNDPTAKISTFG